MRSAAARKLFRVFYVLLILCAVFITLTIALFSQLNLDDYRSTLEQRLSSILNQEVTIGHASLAYRHGLAVRLERLQIGPEAQPMLQAPKIMATLKIKPLFDRQLIFDKILIEKPDINLTYPVAQGQLNKETSQQIFNSFGIKSMTVQNARVLVRQQQGDHAIERLHLGNLYAVLEDWRADHSARLIVSANLPQYDAKLQLESKIPTSSDPAVWRNEDHDLAFTIHRFSTRPLPKVKGQSYPQALDLVVRVKGPPASGTRIQIGISDSSTDETLLNLNANWTSTSTQEAVTDVNADFLGVPLSGEAYSIRHPDNNYLAGRIGISDLELRPELLKKWRIPQADKLLDGDLEELSLIIEKKWPAGEKLKGLPRVAANLVLSNLDWDIVELKQFQDLSVQLELQDNQLALRDGVIIVGGQPIEFDGHIDSPFFQPKVTVDVLLDPSLGGVADTLGLNQWTLAGHLPSRLRLRGQLSKPDFNLHIDLTDSALTHNILLDKRLHEAADLAVSGKLRPQQIDVDEFALNLGKSQIAGSGHLSLDGESIGYQLSTAPIQIDHWGSVSPLADQLRLRGTAQLELEQHQTNLRGRLTLTNAGARLTQAIADLNNVNGDILIDQFGLNFHDLQTRLGRSPVNVTGLLTDWTDPKLSLDIQADEIRAQDLIFPNTELKLNDLDGHLRIDKNDIHFSPVNVRLKEGTLASVKGGVYNFNDPRVELDIHAEKADILSIIELFEGPERTAEQIKASAGELNQPVVINASVDQGTLGNLSFSNARGLIRDHKGRLTISPLRFENGDGWCHARVELSHHNVDAPLKVSGQMVGVNATVLHRDLFEQPGLIDGRMKADFYIEGNPKGDSFWEQAEGGIHLQIKDGVLRKFRSLARIFSLLNVSQIFAGKLPDMSEEGMPFSLIDGTLKISQGKIATEDIFVTSEAMNLSLVGSQNLVNDQLDFTMGVMPLRTVDKIVTNIPLAGWILTGKDKSLLTAHFKITGSPEQPVVTAVPVDSVSQTIMGIFKRTLGLPGKLVKDIGTVLKKEPKEEPGTESTLK